MIKSFQIYLLSLILICSFSAHAEILDDQGNPSPDVQQIVRKFYPYLKSIKDLDDQSKEKLTSNTNFSVEELNGIAQKVFLRPKGSERLSPEAYSHYKNICSNLSFEEQQEIINLFRKIGDIEAVYPRDTDPLPDYILIQGSTVPNMRERVMFLADLITTDKLKFKESTKIVFLAGERALFDSETPDVLMNTRPFKCNPEWHIDKEDLPTDERHAAEMVWQQLDLPKELRVKEPLFVKSEKKTTEKRAQTEDCVATWLTQEDIKEGLYYVISSNPFVHYQKRVTELKFHQAGYKDNFVLKGLGPEAPLKPQSREISIGVLMDNLARCLYIEAQFLKLK